jgi:hypothetical protein
MHKREPASDGTGRITTVVAVRTANRMPLFASRSQDVTLTSLMSEKCKANVSIDAAGRCLLQLLKNAGGPWPQRMPLINSYSVFSLSVFPRRGVTFDLNGWSLPGPDVAAESRRIRLMMRSRVS